MVPLLEPILIPACVADAIEAVCGTAYEHDWFLFYYDWMVDWCSRNDRKDAAEWIDANRSLYGTALRNGYKRQGDI